MKRWESSVSLERRQFLLSLSAKEKAYIILLVLSKLEQLSAKVGEITDDEKVFIRETMTEEETAYYHWAISNFSFLNSFTHNMSTLIPSGITSNDAPIPELIALYIGLETPRDKNSSRAKDLAIEILSARFPSFTVTEGTGYFRGEQERVVVAHIATANPQEVAECAEIVRDALNQEGVGIVFRGRYLRVTQAGIPDLIGEIMHPEKMEFAVGIPK